MPAVVELLRALFDHQDSDAGGDESAEEVEHGNLVDEVQQVVDGERAEQLQQKRQKEYGSDDDERQRAADDHPQKDLNDEK